MNVSNNLMESNRIYDACQKLLEAGEDRMSEYDNCVWEALLATEDQLKAIFSEDWTFQLPVPVHILICQRLALITSDQETREFALSMAAQYCDPFEEERIRIGTVN